MPKPKRPPGSKQPPAAKQASKRPAAHAPASGTAPAAAPPKAASLKRAQAPAPAAAPPAKKKPKSVPLWARQQVQEAMRFVPRNHHVLRDLDDGELQPLADVAQWHARHAPPAHVSAEDGAEGSDSGSDAQKQEACSAAQQANVTRKPSTVDRFFPDNEVIQRVVGDSRYEETTEIVCPAQRFLLLRKNFFFPHLENFPHLAAVAVTSRFRSRPVTAVRQARQARQARPRLSRTARRKDARSAIWSCHERL